MTDSIPRSLQYGCSSSQARVVRNTVQPQGTSNGTTQQQTTFRFKLPEKSLIDLRSLAFYYDYTVSGLTDAATNYSNAYIPASYKHFSSVKFYVSGAIAANGQANHYDQAYHALVRASGSEDWVNSRLNNGNSEIMNAGDAVGAQDISAQPNGYTTRAAHVVFEDILGLPNSKNHVIDTSLFGTVEVELTMAPNSSIKAFRAGTVTNGNLAASLLGTISGIKCMVDTVVSISPLYVSLLAERLQVQDMPIRVPFQNISTQVMSNTGSNRFSLNSSCVDAIIVCPMASDPQTFTAVADNNVLNNTRYAFNSGRTVADANTGLFQIQVGSEVFPRQPIRIDECSDLTTNSLYGNSARSANLLFLGLAGGVPVYNRLNYLTNNAVIVQKFQLGEESWSTGLLTGLNTSGTSVDFVIQTSNLGSHLFVCALMTSQLVFNPANSSVSIEQ